MEIARDSHSIDPALTLGKPSWYFSSCGLCDGTIGPILLAILRKCRAGRRDSSPAKMRLLSRLTVHALFSGIVSNQFYVYWTSGEFV
jgi:hypothetical protein